MNINIEVFVIDIKDYHSYNDDTLEEFTEKQRLFSQFPEYFKLEKWIEGERNYTLIKNGSITVGRETLADMAIAGIKFDVKQKIIVAEDISKQISAMANRPIEIMSKGGGDTYNNKCEVHMPGQALATYNEIMLLGDACSDALQTSINEGYRLIAACPQPNQRRPDYILGRFNPNKEINGSAERG